MSEVTQEDWEAAERWGTGPVYNMQHLAEAFARHRTTALAALEAENAELRAEVERLREALRELCADERGAPPVPCASSGVTAMDDALKPCPFCGGEASMTDFGVVWGDARFELRVSHADDCVAIEWDGLCRGEKADLIAAWNRRAPGRNDHD